MKTSDGELTRSLSAEPHVTRRELLVVGAVVAAATSVGVTACAEGPHAHGESVLAVSSSTVAPDEAILLLL